MRLVKLFSALFVVPILLFFATKCANFTFLFLPSYSISIALKKRIFLWELGRPLMTNLAVFSPSNDLDYLQKNHNINDFPTWRHDIHSRPNTTTSPRAWLTPLWSARSSSKSPMSPILRYSLMIPQSSALMTNIKSFTFRNPPQREAAHAPRHEVAQGQYLHQDGLCQGGETSKQILTCCRWLTPWTSRTSVTRPSSAGQLSWPS